MSVSESVVDIISESALASFIQRHKHGRRARTPKRGTEHLVGRTRRDLWTRSLGSWTKRVSPRTFAKSFLPLTLARLLAGSELQLVTSGFVDGLLNTKTLSRLSQDAFRVDSMVSVLKVLMNTALGLQRDYDNCLKLFVPKLSKGIASIPDELVALIFKFATRQENTLKQTVRLSHVSKRFRRIALAEHCLWATLRTGSSTEELEVCIARSGHNTDLHVVIHLTGIRFFDSILPAFMDVCWPTATPMENANGF